MKEMEIIVVQIEAEVKTEQQETKSGIEFV